MQQCSHAQQAWTRPTFLHHDVGFEQQFMHQVGRTLKNSSESLSRCSFNSHADSHLEPINLTIYYALVITHRRCYIVCPSILKRCYIEAHIKEPFQAKAEQCVKFLIPAGSYCLSNYMKFPWLMQLYFNQIGIKYKEKDILEANLTTRDSLCQLSICYENWKVLAIFLELATFLWEVKSIKFLKFSYKNLMWYSLLLF